jgi:hypothetical protein
MESMKIAISPKRGGWLGTCAAGFSVAEAVISLGIGSFSVGGAMLVNSQQLRLLKSTRESSSASHTLEERIEQLRIATWRQITDPSYISTTFFSALPKSLAPLDGYTEKVTVSAWPDATAATKIEVVKTKGQLVSITSSGAGLADQSLARVDMQISWKSKDGRVRTRELTTMISNAGISRMNLPAMVGGGGSGNSTITTNEGSLSNSNTTDSTGGTQTSSGGTSDGSTTTTVSITKKSKRGTVGGKGGQG